MRRFLGALTLLSALSGCVTSGQELILPESAKYPQNRIPGPALTTWNRTDGTPMGPPPVPPPSSATPTPPPGLLAAEFRAPVSPDGMTAPSPMPPDPRLTPPPAVTPGNSGSGYTASGLPMGFAGSGTPMPAPLAQSINNNNGVQPVGLTQPASAPAPANGMNLPSSSRDVLMQPTFTELPRSQAMSTLKPLAPPVRPAPSVATTVPTPAPAPTNHNVIEVDPGNGAAAAPTIRMVNSKRFTLNYEVRDVGSSGVTNVDLWCTRDSRSWKRYETSFQSPHAHVVEVREEGLYGFTLVARSGAGLSKDTPKPGDQPQIWVMVDLTRPVVNLEGVEISLMAKSPALVIRWNATDRNFASRPITIMIADQATGPWTAIASGLENTGRYEWQPPGAPRRAYLRVEAVDQAGNVGAADTCAPIRIDIPWTTSASAAGVDPSHTNVQPMIDQIRPSVSILGVETRDK